MAWPVVSRLALTRHTGKPSAVATKPHLGFVESRVRHNIVPVGVVVAGRREPLGNNPWVR
jgi:hypothetical protein